MRYLSSLIFLFCCLGSCKKQEYCSIPQDCKVVGKYLVIVSSGTYAPGTGSSNHYGPKSITIREISPYVIMLIEDSVTNHTPTASFASQSGSNLFKYTGVAIGSESSTEFDFFGGDSINATLSYHISAAGYGSVNWYGVKVQ